MKNIRKTILLGCVAWVTTACGDRAIQKETTQNTSAVAINSTQTIGINTQNAKRITDVNMLELKALENGYRIEGYNYNNSTIVLSFCRNMLSYGSLLERFSIVNDTIKSPSVQIETAQGILNINANYDLGVYNDITITSMSAIEC